MKELLGCSTLRLEIELCCPELEEQVMEEEVVGVWKRLSKKSSSGPRDMVIYF
jgi:hypothetical protein